jgi:hypothetical protein
MRNSKINKILPSCLLIIFHAYYAYAQEIQIMNVQMKGENIEVMYNLLDERIDRSYTVNLYTSKDNFIQPMEEVSGDVGVDIPVGNNKKLIWHAKKELGQDFEGDLALELKGNYYVPFITIDGITEGREFERGKEHDIIWSGGRGDNILNFELYRGDDLIVSFEERPNNGNTSIQIPVKVKPGEDYRFRISDKRNRDDVVYTDYFVIKRKVPLSLQLVGTAVVGVGAGILIQFLIPEPPIGDPPLPNR